MNNFYGIDIEKLYTSIQETLFTIKRIKAIRSSYKTTQLEFSNLIGVKYNTYIRWENGSRYPSSAGCALLQIAEDYPNVFMKNRESIVDKIGRDLNLKVR